MECGIQNVVGCSMRVHAGQHYRGVMKSIAPLLKWIDPAYRFLIVSDDEDAFYHPKLEGLRKTNSFTTQALSIILFLHENSKYFHGSLGEGFFKDSPWKHHFTIELTKQRRPAILGKQSFYQYSNELPLLAVANIHEGNECIRFQLLAQNYSRMKAFYSEIFGENLMVVRPDFCYCVLHREPGLQLHFSLKFLPELTPCPTRKAIVIFRMRGVTNDLFEKLTQINFVGSCFRKGKNVVIPDPDGNLVLFELL